MCLTAEALGLFLSIITLENVSIEEHQITVHTPEKDVYWMHRDQMWCTEAAQTGKLAVIDGDKATVI